MYKLTAREGLKRSGARGLRCQLGIWLCLFFLSGQGEAAAMPEGHKPITLEEVHQMFTLSIIILRVNDGAERWWIEEQAADKKLPTKGGWSLSWLGENQFLSVAAGIFQHQANRVFAIAFKGQNTSNPIDTYHGIGIQWQDPWLQGIHKQWQTRLPFYNLSKPANETHSDFRQTHWKPFEATPSGTQQGSSDEMKVSAGAKLYAENLLGLKDQLVIKSETEKTAAAGKALTIVQCIDYLISNYKPTTSNPLTLYVTGDSLGGTAAVLVGTYVFQWLKQQSLPVGSVRLRFSFTNAPALYNPAFVNFYNGMMNDSDIIVDQQFFRLKHDIVSNFFAQDMQGFANDIVNATELLRDGVRAVIVDPVVLYLYLSSQTYTQVGLPDKKTLTTIVNKADPARFHLPERISSIDDLIHYYKFNHFSGSLAASMGIPEVPCPPNGCRGGD